MVDEYVGALVNTLTLHRPADLRLEAFSRFLSEEWDFSTFLEFLSAQNMALQVGAGLPPPSRENIALQVGSGLFPP